MSRLFTLDPDQLSAAAMNALEPVRQNGKISDVYLQFANSEPALIAYLGMEAAIRAGSLEPREIEAVKLRISELSQCEFCLAVHTMKAKVAGLNSEDQMCIRKGQPLGEPRLDALMSIVNHVYHKRGTLPKAIVDQARDVGITDASLVDLTMAMATILFTNITNHINDTKTSLPKAPSL